jgi:hypothetical protein
MATMDPGQRGFGQQGQYNLPDLPFKDMGRPRTNAAQQFFGQAPGERSGGSRSPFADQMKRLFPQGQMPPELLQMLMAQLMGGQGGGRPPQRPPMGGGRPPMGGGRPQGGQRHPMGRPQMGGQRPPMGGGRPPMGRPPMGGQGGGRPPVIKIEDLVRALSGGGGQRPAPQANMAVPQARR